MFELHKINTAIQNRRKPNQNSPIAFELHHRHIAGQSFCTPATHRILREISVRLNTTLITVYCRGPAVASAVTLRVRPTVFKQDFFCWRHFVHNSLWALRKKINVGVLDGVQEGIGNQECANCVLIKILLVEQAGGENESGLVSDR